MPTSAVSGAVTIALAASGAALFAPTAQAAGLSASTTFSSPRATGLPVTATSTVRLSSRATNVSVRSEIVNSAGTVVARRDFTGQTLSATSKKYVQTFRPPLSGNYISRLRVYSAGWNRLLHTAARTGGFTVTPAAVATTTYGATRLTGSSVNATTAVRLVTRVAGVNVRIETLDRAGAVVAHRDYVGQSLSPTARSFASSFRPTTAGTYSTRVRVHAAGWGRLLYSVSGTGSVAVTTPKGSTTTSPTPRPTLTPSQPAPAPIPSPTPTEAPTEPPVEQPGSGAPITAWTAQASNDARQATVGSPFTFSTAVTAPAATSGVTVTVYVDGPDWQVQSTEFNHQTLSPTPKRFEVTVRPTVSGVHRIRVSVRPDGGEPVYWAYLAGVFRANTSGSTTSVPARMFGPGLQPRIMPLGDSITYGLNGDGRTGGNGGYRPALQSELRSQGWNFSMVGPQQDTAGNHAGFPGWRVRDITNGVPGQSPGIASLMATYQPDVVLLHIGTNDFGMDDDEANAAARANALIDRIVAARPGTFVFVSRIIDTYAPVPEQPSVGRYNDAVQAHVNALAAQGKHVYSVDMTRAVTRSGDLGDGVHPTDATYGRMASVWFERLKSVNASM